MVDIQSPAAEIRRGNKKKIVTKGQKYNGLPYSIGRPDHNNHASETQKYYNRNKQKQLKKAQLWSPLTPSGLKMQLVCSQRKR